MNSALLGDLASFTNGGAWSQAEYAEDGVPVVRVTDIKDHTVDTSHLRHLPSELKEKYKKHLLNVNDLVVCTVGSHPSQPGSVVGRTATMPPSVEGALLNQNAVIVRATAKLDQIWLNYFARTDDFHSYIKSCARGSASQVRMSIDLLKKMPVEYPSLDKQQEVGALLKNYDDLIRLNAQRIKILENIAWLLYKHLYETTPSNGMLEVKLEDIADARRGISWERADESSNGQLKVLTIPNIQRYVSFENTTRINNVNARNRESLLVKRNDIIMVGSNGNPDRVGSIARVGSNEKALFASFLMRIRPDESKVLPELLYLLLNDRDVISPLRSGAIGSVTLRNIRISQLRTLELKIPTVDVQNSIRGQLMPIYSMIDKLLLKNINLAKTRDILIGHLMPMDNES